MVSPQATQDDNSSHPNDWPRSAASVRITAQDRRRIVADFLAGALVVQRAVTEGERIDRAAKGSASPLGLYTTDDLRVSNAAAVQQWIASNLTAVSDSNRDFKAVSK